MIIGSTVAVALLVAGHGCLREGSLLAVPCSCFEQEDPRHVASSGSGTAPSTQVKSGGDLRRPGLPTWTRVPEGGPRPAERPLGDV